MKLNLSFDDDLQIIFKLLNYNARLVGGCVRDYILYDRLVEDIDIATPLRPDEVVKCLKNVFSVIPTGLKHGTVTIIGIRKYEITTLRKDFETDGRHANVEFNASYEEDAARRDFTINALYCDYEGNLYDYFNGEKDLEKRYVQFIGKAENRIKEDYLRILRFFRFFMRFGSFSKNDLSVCYELKENLVNLSKERITSEWFNIMKGDYFVEYFNLLIPVLEVLKFKNLGNISTAKLKALSPLGLTAFFYSNDIFLRLSNVEKKYIMNLQNLSMQSQFEANFIFNKYGEHFFKDKQILEGTNFEEIDIPLMPINGQDLLSLGYEGVQIGEILKRLERVWYSNFHITKEDLIKFI